MFLANKTTERVVKIGPHHKNHATAATLAFRKEFLKHSSFRQSDKAGGGCTSSKLDSSCRTDEVRGHNCYCPMSQNTVSKDHLFGENPGDYDLDQLFSTPNY